jgi:hypothetical protein
MKCGHDIAAELVQAKRSSWDHMIIHHTQLAPPSLMVVMLDAWFAFVFGKCKKL